MRSNFASNPLIDRFVSFVSCVIVVRVVSTRDNAIPDVFEVVSTRRMLVSSTFCRSIISLICLCWPTVTYLFNRIEIYSLAVYYEEAW